MKRQILTIILISFIAHSYAMDTLHTKKQTTISAVNAIVADSVADLTRALSDGADIKYQDENKNNFLLLATKEKADRAFIALLNHSYFQKAINYQNAYGETVLIHLAGLGKDELIKKVLTIKNVDINVKNYCGGVSALHFALHYTHPSTIELLIEKGADLMLRGENGETIAFFNSSLLDKLRLSPSIMKKIIDARDAQGNTHIHLLVTANIAKMASRNNTTLRAFFLTNLNNLIKHGVSIWSINRNNELPIESAYAIYKKLHKQAEDTTLLPYLRDSLGHQEHIIHLLIPYYLKNQHGQPIALFSSYAQDLNVESYIADKYKNNEIYYQFSLEKVDAEKKALKTSSSVPVLWQSKQSMNYIPDEIVNSNEETSLITTQARVPQIFFNTEITTFNRFINNTRSI